MPHAHQPTHMQGAMQNQRADGCWADRGFLTASREAREVARRVRERAQKQDAELKRLCAQVQPATHCRPVLGALICSLSWLRVASVLPLA